MTAENIQGLVSVVIPVFNRPDQIRNAVDSVVRQTYCPIEIIIVDDGSDDGATPIALAELQHAHPEIVRVVQQRNQGPGVARETGCRHARGEFLQFLDSDDELLPEKIARQVSLLSNHGECSLAFCLTIARNNVAETKQGAEDIAVTGKLFPTLLNRRWWQTSTPLYRRDIVDRARPWPSIYLYEDWGFEAQVGALGVRYCLVPESLVVFNNHAGHRLRDLAIEDSVTRLQPFARSLATVYRCSKTAGVGSSDREMLQFTHLLLATAVRCARAGLSVNALQLLGIGARESLTSMRPGLMALALKQSGRVFLRVFVNAL